MRKSILLVSVLLCSTALFSQQTPKDAAIKELMNLTGSGKLAAQFAGLLMKNMKDLRPDVPDAYWENFAKEFNSDSIITLFIPVYAKHFSLAEVQQMVAFYKTPIGIKMVHELPAIMVESQKVGAAWGQRVVERTTEKMKKDSAVIMELNKTFAE
ncbi:MAG TPA: DUF2059 domain-containing protein [Arachidicoccus sp.]|nr:DUF2059 domain-containing protein [Arachidicoccus sp.]